MKKLKLTLIDSRKLSTKIIYYSQFKLITFHYFKKLIKLSLSFLTTVFNVF